MSLLTQPEFESQDETNATATVADAPVSEPIREAATNTQVPAAVKSGAVVTAPKAKFQLAFADKADVLDSDSVAQLSLGAYRIKGEQGGCYHEDENLGSVIRLEVVSFNNRWAIGTGNDKQTSEDKERFRISYDGKTISGEGITIDEYIQALKAEGYDKAKSSPYIDLWGFVVWTEKKGEIPEDERELALVQLSQTSAGNWRNFTVSRGMLISKGVAKESDVVEIVAQAQSKGTMKYTNYSFRNPK